MNFDLLTQYQWLKLSTEQRMLLRQEFSIPKSRGVNMVGGVMQSDGSDENDLKAVSVETMRKFLGVSSNEDTFQSLFMNVLQKIDGMIMEEKQQKEKALAVDKKAQEWKEIDNVIENVLMTIDNLPLDAQVAIINSYKHLITPSKEKKHGKAAETAPAEETE